MLYIASFEVSTLYEESEKGNKNMTSRILEDKSYKKMLKLKQQSLYISTSPPSPGVPGNLQPQKTAANYPDPLAMLAKVQKGFKRIE